MTGTYTVAVVPSNTTGSMDLTVYDVPEDATQFITLSPGGTGLALANSYPCQNVGAYFSGTAGQRVSWNIPPTNPPSTSGCCNDTLSIVGPVGAGAVGEGPRAPDTPVCVSDGCPPSLWQEPVTLPADGEYVILFDPAGMNVNSLMY